MCACIVEHSLYDTERRATIIHTSMHTLPCVHIAELYAICACKAKHCTICVHITEDSTNWPVLAGSGPLPASYGMFTGMPFEHAKLRLYHLCTHNGGLDQLCTHS